MIFSNIYKGHFPSICPNILPILVCVSLSQQIQNTERLASAEKGHLEDQERDLNHITASRNKA